MIENNYAPMSDKTNKIRNRMLFTSFILLFIIYFNPSFSGFLGNFSITVENYSHLVPIIIALFLSYLIYEFGENLAVDHDSLSYSVNIKEMFNSLTNACYSKNSKLLDLYKERSQYEHALNQQNNGTKFAKTFSPNGLKELQVSILQLTKQKNTVKRLIVIDIIIPIFISAFTLISIPFNFESLQNKFKKTESPKIKKEYQVDSALFEVKDIKFKEINN